MGKELKDSELNEISGGIATEITEKNGKWRFNALWGSEFMSAEFDTKEEAQKYEKEVVALSKVFDKKETPESSDRRAFDIIYNSKKRPKRSWWF